MDQSEEDLLRDFPDRAVREMLEDPKNLRELIAAVLPDLVDGFDFSRAELLKRDFLMEDWRKRESDLLFRIPYRDEDGERTVLVCILVEHQSRPDARMPLRILTYVVLYWNREWKRWEQAKTGGPLRLTPVVPIVFHTGASAWRSNRELSDLIDGPDVLKSFAPKYTPLFWDLAEHTIEELLENVGEWFRSLAIIRAENESTEEYTAVLEHLMRALDSLSENDRQRWNDLHDFCWAGRSIVAHKTTGTACSKLPRIPTRIDKENGRSKPWRKQ